MRSALLDAFRPAVRWCFPFWMLLGGLAACDSVRELSRRCAEGDSDACASACEEGVFGEGGCFRAGQAEQRRAGTDYAGPEWHRATKFFRKACEGGHADGCLLAAQLVEAPYASIEPSGKEKGQLINAIGDEQVDERRRWLERACDLKSEKGCERLGDVTIGKKSDAAEAAYLRACDLGGAPKACRKARKKEVAAFELYRDGCRRGQADDCTALGNLVFRVDFPRAVRIFMAEMELRGIGPSVGGVQAFVERRMGEARMARVLDPTVAVEAPSGRSAEAPSGRSVEIRWEGLAVEGRLARTFAERALGLAEPRLSSCLPAGKTGPTEARITLTVDRTGDVFEADVEGPAPGVAACLENVLKTVTMQRPLGELATVRRRLILSLTDPADGGS